MRENRQSGSAGGVRFNTSSLPLSRMGMLLPTRTWALVRL